MNSDQIASRHRSRVRGKVRAYVDTIRPSWTVINVARVDTAMFLAALGLPDLTLLGIGTALGAVSGFAGLAFNDSFDVEVDKINDPDRPIPSGRLTVKEVRRFAYLCAVSVVLLSLVRPITTVFGLSVVLPTGFTYAVYFKNRVVGPVIFGLWSSSIALAGALGASGGINLLSALWAAIVGLVTIGSIIAEGLADMEGDRTRGKRTFAVAYGWTIASSSSFSAFATAFLIIVASEVTGVLPLMSLLFGAPFFTLALVIFLRSLLTPSPSVSILNKKLSRFSYALLIPAVLSPIPSVFSWSYAAVVSGVILVLTAYSRR